MAFSRIASVPNRPIRLRDGSNIPAIGYGTFQLKGEEARLGVETALQCGYRYIDTAHTSQNQGVIGQVLREWIGNRKVARDELFISTKHAMIGNRACNVNTYLDKSLTRLSLGYFDLFVLHRHVGLKGNDDVEKWAKDEDRNAVYYYDTDLLTVYRAMEDQIYRGFVNSIGLSNFSCEQIKRIMRECFNKPAIYQIEMHAYFQQKDMRDFCRANNIPICVYLGAPYNTPKGLGDVPLLMENPVVTSIASGMKKTPAQILQRFFIQNNVVSVISNSSGIEKIRNNLQVFDFELNHYDMASLENLDLGI